MVKRKQVKLMTSKPQQYPKVSWLEIDPTRAQTMLNQLESNRKLISNHVSFLASEMRAGNWKINGDTIRFSAKRLLDGQHRLHAVIQSGVTIVALVVEELEDSAFDTIDVGRGRQAGDVLSTIGVGNAFMTAAVARFIWYYDHDVNLDSATRVSNHEIISTVKKNPLITTVIEFLVTRKQMRASPIGAALVLIGRKVGLELVMYYADKLVNGTDLKAEDPVRYFRDKWLMETRHRSSRGDRVVWIASCIKTFNAWKAKKKTDHVERWRLGETFPEVEV